MQNSHGWLLYILVNELCVYCIAPIFHNTCYANGACVLYIQRDHTRSMACIYSYCSQIIVLRHLVYATCRAECAQVVYAIAMRRCGVNNTKQTKLLTISLAKCIDHAIVIVKGRKGKPSKNWLPMAIIVFGNQFSFFICSRVARSHQCDVLKWNAKQRSVKGWVNPKWTLKRAYPSHSNNAHFIKVCWWFDGSLWRVWRVII